MANGIRDLVKDVVASPLGDVIASVGEGVAAAQQALDEASLAKTLEIYSDAENPEEVLTLLRDIGYRPTFYTLPETTGEVKVALRLGNNLTGRGTASTNQATSTLATSTALKLKTPAVNASLARIGRNISSKPKIYATPVDAGYANQFGYQADISAKLTFKIVPVPAPEGADELRVIPNLVTKSVAVANERLESIGLVAVFENAEGEVITPTDDTQTISQQTPDPSMQRIGRLGDEIRLRLS